MKQLALVLILSAVPTATLAQSAPTGSTVLLPTNAELWVTLDRELNSQRIKAGERFPVSVSRDVMVGGRIVIPRGTPGVGEVTYRTGRGAFGKSGKMEVQLREVALNGRRLPIAGRFRQEGQGNTGATIGTIVAAGVIAGALVTGHSAVFEQGREFRALTTEALPLDTPPRRFAAVTADPMPVAVAFRPVAVAVTAPVPLGPSGLTAAERYQQKLAAARGVRGYEPRLGWTISD